jgi:hypothetical protein
MSAPIPIGVRFIGGTLMLASACPFGYFAISMLRKNYDRATKGAVASGVVIGFQERHGSGAANRAYFPEVEFQTPSGEKITFVSSVGSNAEPKLGHKVKVSYYPDKPQDADTSAFFTSWFFPLFLFVCAIIFLLISLLFYSGGGSGA